MAQQTRVVLRSSLSGTTDGGSVCAPQVAFDLLGQDTHGTNVITVEPSDVLKSISLPYYSQEPGTKQTLFMLQTTGDVEVRLNNEVKLSFSLAANGTLIFSGQPEVGVIELTSLQATEFKVSATRIFGASTLPDPGNGPPSPGGGGSPLVQDSFTATAGQTAFALSAEPNGAVMMFVEGVMYSSPTFFTRIGQAVTWLDVFVLPLGARVEFIYN